jgi:hypothetical protein
MSEEYVQPPIDVGFTKEAVLTSEPPKEEESTFESNDVGLREAAEERVGETPEPVAITLNDSESGKPRPANETLSAESAARELANYRNSIEDQKTAQSEQVTRELIDNIQGNAQNPELRPQAQPAEQQQPPPQPVEAQPTEQLPPGIDPTLAKALTENPQLREALRAEVAQIQAAQQSYIDVTRANAQTAAAALFASYPELRGILGDQIKAAIQVISNQNPQRGAEIVAHIAQVNATVSEWQAAQSAQQTQAHR